VSQELLWLRHEDSLGIQRKGRMSAVGSRYQMAGEESADPEGLVCAVVKVTFS
jgi:hypothetical protein